jgi:hypothetical protein
MPSATNLGRGRYRTPMKGDPVMKLRPPFRPEWWAQFAPPRGARLVATPGGLMGLAPPQAPVRVAARPQGRGGEDAPRPRPALTIRRPLGIIKGVRVDVVPGFLGLSHLLGLGGGRLLALPTFDPSDFRNTVARRSLEVSTVVSEAEPAARPTQSMDGGGPVRRARQRVGVGVNPALIVELISRDPEQRGLRDVRSPLCSHPPTSSGAHQGMYRTAFPVCAPLGKRLCQRTP